MQKVGQSLFSLDAPNDQLAAALGATLSQAQAPGGAPAAQRGRAVSPSSAPALPGLQDLRGQFSGSLQAFGSSGGATSVEFDLKGNTWKWGDYGLDQVGGIVGGVCVCRRGGKGCDLGQIMECDISGATR